MNKKISVGKLTIGNEEKLILIAGPCVIESEQSALKIAEKIKAIAGEVGIGYIFKASYDKANRQSVKSYRGPGIKKGLKILNKIRKELDIPVLTDVHSPHEALMAAEAADILQVPALLSRQTDLVLAAAKTMLPVNVKKGQFLSPWDVKYIIEKIESVGNKKIMLTERGTVFGYNNLVVDMRSLPVMAAYGYPVIFDVTHSIQEPGRMGHASGGKPEYIQCLAKAAVATGIAGIFVEVHPSPEKALSDGACMLKLNNLKALLRDIKKIDEAI